VSHIVIHTQYYPPETGAPQARLSELAAGLARNGFQVTVLTAMPNYPQGRIYPGYGGLFKQEKAGGVRVVRTAIIPSQSAATLPRLVNYFSFVLSSFVAGLLALGRVDAIITESPPLFLGLTGYLLSRLKRARWIFNVSDLWPESAVRLGVVRPGLALRLSYALEAMCYRKAWLITGQSRSILSDVRARFEDVETFLLSNGVDTGLFAPRLEPDRSIERKSDELLAVYAGLHGLAQGLEHVVNAAASFQGKMRFLFVGDGPEKKKLVALAARLNLSNVEFLPARPRCEIPGLLAVADVCIVPLKTHLSGAVPSKIYEAMACSKPILLIAEGEAAEIVTQSCAGLVVKPGDAKGLVAALNSLAVDAGLRARLGKSGRAAAVERFDRRMIVDQFASFLKDSGLN